MTDKRRFSSDGERVATAEPEVKWRIRPRYKWVLLRKLETEERMEDGVIKPGANSIGMEGSTQSSRGVIVEVSDRIKDLKPGDIVIFTDFPIKLKEIEEYLPDESDLCLVRDEEVYAAVERCE